MKKSPLLPFLIISLCALGAAYLLRPGQARVSSAEAPVPEVGRNLSQSDLGRVTAPAKIAVSRNHKQEVAGEGTGPWPEQERYDSYVSEKIVELSDLAMQNDPASLNSILMELGNSDGVIRKAACEAAIQFGSKDAIPALRTAEANASNSEEKVNLVKAIEFLALTNVTEMLNGDHVPR